jgi:hypothetical protein
MFIVIIDSGSQTLEAISLTKLVHIIVLQGVAPCYSIEPGHYQLALTMMKKYITLQYKKFGLVQAAMPSTAQVTQQQMIQ